MSAAALVSGGIRITKLFHCLQNVPSRGFHYYNNISLKCHTYTFFDAAICLNNYEEIIAF